MSNVIDMPKRLLTNVGGTEYELSTKLRVAYKVQGQNGHKPYSEIFKDMGNMPIEKQISILYCAFEVANPEEAKVLSFQKFLDWYLDNYNVTTIMEQLQDIVGGILGQDLKAEADKQTDSTSEGN